MTIQDKIVTEAMIEAGVKAIRSLPVRPGGYVEYDAIAQPSGEG
jgi:hypothetical protein